MSIIPYIFDYYNLLLGGNLLLSLCTLPKSILKPTSQCLHVSHTSGTNSSPALGLGTPIIIPHFLGGVATAWACLLLDVVRSLATTATCRVRLVVPFSEGCGSLSLLFCIVRDECWHKKELETCSLENINCNNQYMIAINPSNNEYVDSLQRLVSKNCHTTQLSIW